MHVKLSLNHIFYSKLIFLVHFLLYYLLQTMAMLNKKTSDKNIQFNDILIFTMHSYCIAQSA